MKDARRPPQRPAKLPPTVFARIRINEALGDRIPRNHGGPATGAGRMRRLVSGKTVNVRVNVFENRGEAPPRDRCDDGPRVDRPWCGKVQQRRRTPCIREILIHRRIIRRACPVANRAKASRRESAPP
ncbi:MAG: hypothetical protein AMXMBFR22_10730 [Phycisphaerae bacterium]